MLKENFNACEWRINGEFADNHRTGERILLDRFQDEYKEGILYNDRHSPNEQDTITTNSACAVFFASSQDYDSGKMP